MRWADYCKETHRTKWRMLVFHNWFVKRRDQQQQRKRLSQPRSHKRDRPSDTSKLALFHLLGRARVRQVHGILGAPARLPAVSGVENCKTEERGKTTHS